MGFLRSLFSKQEHKPPEAWYSVTITPVFVRVEHPERQTEQIAWSDIEEIKLVNTDEGPWLPDAWLALLGKSSGCLVPQGATGFDEIYDIVSKYEGFNFENVGKSMQCADNAQFVLWVKK